MQAGCPCIASTGMSTDIQTAIVDHAITGIGIDTAGKGVLLGRGTHLHHTLVAQHHVVTVVIPGGIGKGQASLDTIGLGTAV